MIRTILTGYDGTEEAERALARSAELAERFNAHVIVLTAGQSMAIPRPELVPALDPLTAAAAGPMVPAFPPESAPSPVEAELDAPTMRLLERARSTLAAQGVDAEYVAAMGDPTELLLDAADEHDADLVVVGSRERGFLERLLGAGVDEKLARKTRRDILLVH
jgi:nucleotide-binding universal stress UspA family protein